MKQKIALFTLCGLLALFGVAGCGPKNASKSSNSTSSTEKEFSFTAELLTGNDCLRVGGSDTLLVDYDDDLGVDRSFTVTSSDTTVLSVEEVSGGFKVTGLKLGKASLLVTEKASGLTQTLTLTVAENAGGVATYTTASYDEKATILGKLEKYAVENFLTGITLFEDGGTVMYNPRVKKGTENYISGYGFGILGEGSITEPLAAETVDAWKLYYHSASASDPKKVNYLNDKGSEVSDFYSYVASSYYGTKMNATKDGYDWYPVLAKGEPVAINADEYGYSNTWQIKVKTGKDGLKFATASTKYAEYNGKEVTIADYIFPFQVLLTQSVGYVRGSELAADTTSGFDGGKKYYSQTETVSLFDDNGNLNPDMTKLFDELVGIKAIDEETLQFTLLKSVSPFYAKYYLSSNLYSPINSSFFYKVGSESYGMFKQSDNTTPVDNILSLSPYTLEYWEQDKLVCYKRNPEWVEFKDSDSTISSRYSIEGVHIDIITAAKSDSEAVFNEFIAGKLDAASIPQSQLSKYKNDSRTTKTKGSSNFKLNVNSCTKERWEELFGEDGVITTTKKSDYWDVKPWMSNTNFLRGLSASIDRETFADNRGVIASNDYLSAAYLINPEEGISYNSTQAHKDAVKGFFPETNGYNYGAATTYFSLAVEELVEEGQLELGTKSNPTNISIVIEWMNPSDTENYGAELATYFEKAFNDDAVCGGAVKLTVVNHDGTSDYTDVYYKHLMVGQFDLGFGAISGNTLDPINFFEVLKSDNSSGFTLNWGADTNDVSDTIGYDGQFWSFDALWTAANTGGVFEDGVEVAALSSEVTEIIEDTTAGSITVKIDFVYNFQGHKGITYTLNRIDVYLVGVGNLTLTLDEDYTLVVDETTGENHAVVTFDASTIAFLDYYLQAKYGETAYKDYAHVTEAMYGTFWVFEIYVDISFNGAMPQTLYTTAL